MTYVVPACTCTTYYMYYTWHVVEYTYIKSSSWRTTDNTAIKLPAVRDDWLLYVFDLCATVYRFGLWNSPLVNTLLPGTALFFEVFEAGHFISHLKILKPWVFDPATCPLFFHLSAKPLPGTQRSKSNLFCKKGWIWTKKKVKKPKKRLRKKKKVDFI